MDGPQRPRRMSAARFPVATLGTLDTLWFQVGGTLCNLACKHCFISCSPGNETHPLMTLAQVERFLAEAVDLGVREYYFTGGEPFLNRELLPMIEAALRIGPVTVLTNGVLIREPVAAALAALAGRFEYSLDLRISLDGWDAATNDPIRGEGTFERIVAGIEHLGQVGLNPVITVTAACEPAVSSEGRTRFLAFLRAIGLKKPRLKVMPLLRIGAESGRGRPYAPWETLRDRALSPGELEALQCTSSRMVTASGVYVCPILLETASARLADTLRGSMVGFPLSHQACYTCHAEGLSCRT